MEELDPPNDIMLLMAVRVFLLQHADTGIPVMRPEQAYPAYDTWRLTMSMPAMTLEDFTRHFLEQRRLYRAHLKGLHPIIGPAGQVLAPAEVEL